ncbi:hypothetical protein B0H67DRAFT_640998 [Lasiosphaeris hirsuta]|uniref:Uncharacterized protein n=1 Tax=Lasiosphaeris hirsuta TaxID=260670 RepID=A0AA40AYR8_9PEZI|nr:hypothetical protein B0H67DRAFT_640998 [Lasiosphaeris hirsuta]
MAEVFGLVASIAGFVQIAVELGKACKSHIDAVKDAEDLLRDVQRKAATLANVLEDMGKLGNTRLGKSKSLHGVLEPNGDLKACEDVVNRLKDLVDRRLKDINPSSPRRRAKMKAWARTWDSSWIKDVEKLSKEMDEYRVTINGALQMELNLAIPLGFSSNNHADDRLHPKRRSRESSQAASDWRAKIADWLAPKNHADDQRQYSSRRAKGTSRWILGSKQYQEWRENKARTLFCRGVPGAGKTFIAAAVIEHLDGEVRQSEGSKVGLIYLYFHYNDPESDHKAQSLLSNLLGQLTRTLPVASPSKPPGYVQSLYETHGRQGSISQPSLEDVSKAFQQVAGCYDYTFVVLDALDECRSHGEREKFLSQVLQMQSVMDLRVFATSRLGSEMPVDISRSVRIRATDEDIQVFLDGSMPELGSVVKKNEELAAEVRREITKKADGIFLLAQIYIKRLKGLSTATQIREELAGIRAGKDESETLQLAYGGLVERIDNLPSGNLAKKALMWAAFSTRALTVSELLHALAVAPKLSKLTVDDLPHINDVVQACCGLLEVNEKTQMTRLAHSTTREYLRNASLSHVWLQQADGDLAGGCISYICLEVFRRGPIQGINWYSRGELDSLLLNHPLLGYASSNWASHLSGAGKFRGHKYLEELCNSKENLLLSFQIHNIANRQSFSDGVSAVHIISSLGSPQILRCLSELESRDGKFDRGAMDKLGRTAMHYAAARTDGKAHEMIKELLSLRFDIDAVDGDGRTPLHVSARSGDTKSVGLLVENRADTEVMMGTWSATPLTEACCGGHVGVVEVLMAARANVNAKSDKFGTPLEAAILGVSEACVKALLANKRLKRSLPTEFGTALHDACYRGDPGIVKLLLDAGFDANEAGDRGTPLQVAISGDHDLGQARDASGVIQLLLDRGADINRRSDFGTALDTAEDLDNRDLGQMLMEKGAVKTSKTARRKITRNDSSQLAANIDPNEPQLLPEALRNRARQLLVAVMMDNDKLVRQHTETRIATFQKAIKAGKIGAVKTLAQLSMLEFEAMVDVAKLDIEQKAGNGKGRPRYSRLYNLVVIIAARSSHMMASLLGLALGIQRPRSQELSATLHGIDAASSKLEIMTSACVEILGDAIEFGDGDMVQMIAKYFMSSLRRVFLAGETGNQILEVLVNCRAQQLEVYFRDNDMEKAILLAEVGLELMTVVLNSREEDERMKLSLIKIWSLALRNAINNGYADYQQMEDFFWKNADTRLRHRFAEGVWQPYKRLGAAVIETLSGIIADRDICVALAYARSVAHDMDDALKHGGWLPLVDGILFRHLETEVWAGVEQIVRREDDAPQDLAGTSLWNVVGSILNIFHATVRYSFDDVTVRLEELMVRNLDQLRQHGRTVGGIACRQLLEYIPAWCEIDGTSLYCFRTWSALHLIAQATKDPEIEEAFRREMIGVFTRPSPELSVLEKRTKEVLSGSEPPGDGARMLAAIDQFQKAMGMEGLWDWTES